jgi:hypothetical protein
MADELARKFFFTKDAVIYPLPLVEPTLVLL